MKTLSITMKIAFCTFALFRVSLLSAQESPFVSPEVNNALRNELSGDIAYDNLRILTQFHRPSGSIGLLKAFRFLEEKARGYGLEGVQLYEQDYDGLTYEPISGTILAIEPQRWKIASFEEIPLHLADFSRSTNLTAELIDIGDGNKDSDYQGHDVKGKVVVAASPPGQVMPLAVWKYGAAGLVCHFSGRVDPFLGADQVPWGRIPFESRNGKEGTFAFILSPRQGLDVKDFIKKNHPVQVKVDIETRFHEPKQWYLEAWIKGTSVDDQDIVLTGHAQEEMNSANDDGSGCVNVLEIARALSRLIEAGVLPRPRRNIRFWWTTEISSEYQLWKDQPQMRDRLLANINQDMVGARLSLGNRVQHVSLPPLSRHSYLTDIVSSVANAVIQGNNAFLSARQQSNRSRSMYLNPIYARIGSRDPYAAMVVPYFNYTDHMTFIDGPGGIPAITLTNWPDEIIHSSDDDLWTIDRTNLKRNAYVAAAIAWYLANADATEIPKMAAQIYGNGLARIGRALKVALTRMSSPINSDEIALAYHDAMIILDESVAREMEAFETLQVFAEDRQIPALALQYQEKIQEHLKIERRQVNALYRSLTDNRPPGDLITAEELRWATKVAVANPDLKAYFDNRSKVTGVGSELNPHMRNEVWNFVNDRRSVYEIYRAVFAEASVFGHWYYGTVKLDDVAGLIEAAVEKNALSYR